MAGRMVWDAGAGREQQKGMGRWGPQRGTKTMSNQTRTLSSEHLCCSASHAPSPSSASSEHQGVLLVAGEIREVEAVQGQTSLTALRHPAVAVVVVGYHLLPPSHYLLGENQRRGH